MAARIFDVEVREDRVLEQLARQARQAVGRVVVDDEAHEERPVLAAPAPAAARDRVEARARGRPLARVRLVERAGHAAELRPQAPAVVDEALELSYFRRGVPRIAWLISRRELITLSEQLDELPRLDEDLRAPCAHSGNQPCADEPFLPNQSWRGWTISPDTEEFRAAL